MKPVKEAKCTTIRYNSGYNTKFAVTVFLFCKVYSMLQNNCIATFREIYYQYVNEIHCQYEIEQAMNTISNMLNIEPWYLPIVSTSKGLVYGNLQLTTAKNEIVNCNTFGGILIPENIIKIQKFDSNAAFILVVEKDAIFKKLLDENAPSKMTRSFILITGKGYPDTNTRLFLKILSSHLKIPTFILVDADPYGIDIMLTYKFGSRTKSHLAEHLAVPNLKWIGIHPREMIMLGITQQILPDRDKNKLKNILTRPYVKENSQIKQEVQFLLDNNFKAEIEGIIKNNYCIMDSYLSNKLYSQTYT